MGPVRVLPCPGTQAVLWCLCLCVLSLKIAIKTPAPQNGEGTGDKVARVSGHGTGCLQFPVESCLRAVGTLCSGTRGARSTVGDRCHDTFTHPLGARLSQSYCVSSHSGSWRFGNRQTLPGDDVLGQEADNAWWPRWTLRWRRAELGQGVGSAEFGHPNFKGASLRR